MPETCTKDECPYICEEFITPNGISIEEILDQKVDTVEGDGFLSMISEDLKVKYSSN
jgi:hypothetical protein